MVSRGGSAADGGSQPMLLVVALLAAAALMPRVEALTREEMVALVEPYFEKWGRLDLEGVAASFNGSGVFEFTGNGPSEGPEAIRRDLKSLFTKAIALPVSIISPVFASKNNNLGFIAQHQFVGPAPRKREKWCKGQHHSLCLDEFRFSDDGKILRHTALCEGRLEEFFAGMECLGQPGPAKSGLQNYEVTDTIFRLNEAQVLLEVDKVKEFYHSKHGRLHVVGDKYFKGAEVGDFVDKLVAPAKQYSSAFTHIAWSPNYDANHGAVMKAITVHRFNGCSTRFLSLEAYELTDKKKVLTHRVHWTKSVDDILADLANCPAAQNDKPDRKDGL